MTVSIEAYSFQVCLRHCSAGSLPILALIPLPLYGPGFRAASLYVAGLGCAAGRFDAPEIMASCSSWPLAGGPQTIRLREACDVGSAAKSS
jgi:hypothetical protein